MAHQLSASGTPKKQAVGIGYENTPPVVNANILTPSKHSSIATCNSPSQATYLSPPPYYDDELYGPKTQKISFKPPARNTTSAIYEWAGYEFCLSKSFLNEKTCAELRKKYKALKDLPPGLDYNAIHAACSLNADMLHVMIQQYRDFLNDTQLVAPGPYESLFHYLDRIQKLTAKTEKKSKSQ